jgi:hypothetical protein
MKLQDFNVQYKMEKSRKDERQNKEKESLCLSIPLSEQLCFQAMEIKTGVLDMNNYLKRDLSLASIKNNRTPYTHTNTQ